MSNQVSQEKLPIQSKLTNLPTRNITIKLVKSVLTEYTQNTPDLSENFRLEDILDKFGEFDLTNNTTHQNTFKSLVRIIYMSDGGKQNLAAYLTLKALTQTKTREQIIRYADFGKQIRTRDICCRLTGMGGLLTRRCEAAHILDFALCDTEAEKYDLDNGILLFDGIHKSWDAGYLIAIPDPTKNRVEFSIRDGLELSADDILQNLPEFTRIRTLENISPGMMHYFTARYQIDLKRFGTN